MELTQASTQWATRPADERFTSLPEMLSHYQHLRQVSRETVVPSRQLEFSPVADDPKQLLCYGPNGHGYAPTHLAFAQAAKFAEAPANYLRTLPAAKAADLLNYGFQVKRRPSEVGVLIMKNGSSILRALTGPNYGRVWNDDVINAVIGQFGDGVNGHFRVPGIFGKALTSVTKENTTLFGGDQSMFVFLADEERRIEVPNRRNGKPGSLARGFFLWNSEVQSTTFASLGVMSFLFDEVCANRIVWGATELAELRIRHTSSAPDRWIAEVAPALEAYASSSTASIEAALSAARNRQMDGKLDSFLNSRFGKKESEKIKIAFHTDEGRPIETLWDVVTGVTALARAIPHQDARIELERKAGDILFAAA
jgi:hypothetical protein